MSDKTYVILNFEEDWDYPHIYFHITEDGIMVKYNILTDEVIEYKIDRVVH